eukprot:RCo029014
MADGRVSKKRSFSCFQRGASNFSAESVVGLRSSSLKSDEIAARFRAELDNEGFPGPVLLCDAASPHSEPCLTFEANSAREAETNRRRPKRHKRNAERVLSASEVVQTKLSTPAPCQAQSSRELRSEDERGRAIRLLSENLARTSAATFPRRIQLYRVIRDSLVRAYPGSSVLLYGSTFSGTLLPGGDLDVVFVPGPGNTIDELTFFQAARRVLRDALRAHLVIIPARVPILKVCHPTAGCPFPVDLSFGSLAALRGCALVRELLSGHPM